MSGGHWNYQQDKVRYFGEELQEDRDPVLSALGDCLIEIADALKDCDWTRSGDCGPEVYDAAIERLTAIIGRERVKLSASCRLSDEIERATRVMVAMK